MVRPLTWVVASNETAARWSRALEQAGMVALPLPWSEVEALDSDATRRALETTSVDRVLFTSAYAAQVLPAGAGQGLLAACVGARTAEAARAAGFEVMEVGRSGAADVVARLLEADPPPRRVLFLATSEAREEAVESLRGAGVEVERLDVYRVMERDAFSTEAARARPPSVVLLGSPRALSALCDPAVPFTWRGAACVAPGPTTERALRAAGLRRVHCASGPTLEQLVEAVKAAYRAEGISP